PAPPPTLHTLAPLCAQRGLVFLGLCIVILICYGASRTPGYTGVAIFEMVFSIVFFVIYTLGLNKQLSFVHWGWSDFVRALIGALLFLITSLIVVIGHRDGAGIAAGVKQLASLAARTGRWRAP
uniref:Proteolipid protein 2 n=1 Tax=Terrapene triunguis TaxID=2587831 RepID=A0A674IYX3_9SAUR